MKNIIDKIKSGDLARSVDKINMGGFWDLSGDIVREIDDLGSSASDILQEEIFNHLWKLYELLSNSIKTFKFKVGDSVINKTNWNYYIIGRYRNEKGENFYLVVNNEDEYVKIEEDNHIIWHKDWQGLIAENSIRRMA